VVEANVHYPTDINLLFDAMRKSIQQTADYAQRENIMGWRQYQLNVRQVKRAYRQCQQQKRSTSKNKEKIKVREALLIKSHHNYIKLSQKFLNKCQVTLAIDLKDKSFGSIVLSLEIEGFMKHAVRQIEQIERRVIKGEKIPHNEKVFSLFQPHTEWISKGKVGVPVELGLRVCVVESNSGYILNHRVMEKEVDNQIAVELIKETQLKFQDFNGCSFDKGFHSPENQIELNEILDQVILPKKGRCNQKEKERESSEEFRYQKRKHSAVESGINALEVHGLDKCLDHGLNGFKRYVGLAIVARNIQKLGSELIKITRQKKKRKAVKLKLAA